MQAQDIMTKPVIFIGPDDTVARAIRVMLQNHISGLPVVDAAGCLVGMITEGDFLRRVETATERKRPRWLEFLAGGGQLASEYVRTHARRVSDVMTADPVVVAEDAPLEDVVTLMEKRRIKRVPVVKDGKVVGIVSRANLLHALASVAGEAAPAKVEDQVIRQWLLAELEQQSWAPSATLDVVVRDGVVDLWGTITDERTRQALIVAAENVPGVKRVNDHVAWIDPTSGMLFQPNEEAAAEVGRPS
jgi:CBS domain-containing protein